MFPIVEPRQRPERFLLNRFSPLAENAAFLGLGGMGCVDSAIYPDATQLLGRNPSHGTLTNMDPATDWSRDLGRAVLKFDASDDYVLLPTDLTRSAIGTVAMWHYVHDVNSGLTRLWSVKEGTDDRSFIAAVIHDGNGGMAYDGRVTIQIRPDNVDSINAYGSTIIANGWHHFAWTQNGTGPTIYVDGVQQSLTALVGSTATPDWWDDLPAGAAWNLARFYYNNAAYYSAAETRQSDVCVYNRALSPAETSALADPSNVMIEVGGVPLILPPRRATFPAAVAEPTGTIAPLVYHYLTRMAS